MSMARLEAPWKLRPFFGIGQTGCLHLEACGTADCPPEPGSVCSLLARLWLAVTCQPRAFSVTRRG